MQHLLHAGSALGTLVADDDDIAGLHLLAEDLRHRLLLRLAHDGRAREDEDRRVDTGGLDDGAVDGEVAPQHREAAVGGVGVCGGADAAVLGILIQARPALGL